MKTLLVILCLFGFTSLTHAQQIQSYTFQELEEKINSEAANQPLVVNFWATWCAPCVKELPHFESLAQDFSDAKVKVLLVSLDMEKEKAVRFSEKKQLKSEVAYLDEVDFNAWINKISPDWSGAIPATLFVSPTGEKNFHEGEFNKAELYEHVKRFINKTEKL